MKDHTNFLLYEAHVKLISLVTFSRKFCEYKKSYLMFQAKLAKCYRISNQ